MSDKLLKALSANWLETEITINGTKVPVVFRKLAPGDYFDVYGGIFASVGKPDPKAAANNPEESKKQIAAAQLMLHKGLVEKVGGTIPAFPLAEIEQIGLDDLNREFSRLLEFSGLTEEGKKKVRRFRGAPKSGS